MGCLTTEYQIASLENGISTIELLRKNYYDFNAVQIFRENRHSLENLCKRLKLPIKVIEYQANRLTLNSRYYTQVYYLLKRSLPQGCPVEWTLVECEQRLLPIFKNCGYNLHKLNENYYLFDSITNHNIYNIDDYIKSLFISLYFDKYQMIFSNQLNTLETVS